MVGPGKHNKEAEPPSCKRNGVSTLSVMVGGRPYCQISTPRQVKERLPRWQFVTPKERAKGAKRRRQRDAKKRGKLVDEAVNDRGQGESKKTERETATLTV